VLSALSWNSVARALCAGCMRRFDIVPLLYRWWCRSTGRGEAAVKQQQQQQHVGGQSDVAELAKWSSLMS
jgi:hypothetical protein